MVIVRKQQRLVGTSVTAADVCTETLHHCVDTDAVLTLKDLCVQSVTECFREMRL